MKYFKKEIGFIVALLFLLISCLPFDSASAVSSKAITKIEFKQAQQNLIAGSTGQLALVGTVSGKKKQSIKLPNKNIEISSSNKFIYCAENTRDFSRVDESACFCIK